MGKPIVLELKVYRLAERLADTIYAIVVNWESFPRAAVGERLVRSVDRIGACIAMGHSKGMSRTYRRAIRASFNESLYWLRRAAKRDLLTPEQVDQVKPLFDELGPRIKSYLKRMGQRAGARRSSA
jgi:four helix bundle protein